MPSDLELLSSDTPASSDAPAAADPVQGVPAAAVQADPAAVTPDPSGAAPQPEAAQDPAAQTPQVDPNQPQAGEEAPLESEVEDPLTVKALNDKVSKSAELQAAMSKDPGLRNLLYATARQAQQAAEFKHIFQTPAQAQTAFDLANKHVEFENTVRSNPTAALQSIYEMTAQRDANGQVIWDQPNPAYVEAMTNYREQNLWAPSIEHAEGLGNQKVTLANGQIVSAEDVRDALVISALFFGDKIQSKASPFVKPGEAQPQQNNLDPETAAKLQRLDELEQGQRTQEQTRQAEYTQGVVTGIGDSVTKAATGYIDNLLKAKPNVVLTDFIKSVVIEKAVKEIYELAKNDVSYQNHINFLYNSARVKDEGLRTKLVAEATKYARERFPKIIAKHIGEASKGVVASQQQRHDKQEGQKRPEVQGTAGVSTPSRQDPAERVKEFVKAKGRKPTDRELMDL